MSIYDLELQKTKSGYFYIDMGHELHGKKSFRLWVSGQLAERLYNPDREKYELPLPLNDVDITETKKGSLVLHDGQYNLFQVFANAGYRGEGFYQIETSYIRELPFEVYHSPRGNLGISKGAFVITENDFVIFSWERTGRLYGSSPRGRTKIFLDREKEPIQLPPKDNELEELL